MVKGSGIDILGTGRFCHMENKSEFISNFLTPREKKRAQSYFHRDLIYAALFAMKEAILKSLACGLGHGSLWHRVELDTTILPPIFRSLSRLTGEHPAERVHISVACTKDYALSVALAETEGSP
jgi:phosphopantetheinyl transferase (holo-ACP synthase)